MKGLGGRPERTAGNGIVGLLQRGILLAVCMGLGFGTRAQDPGVGEAEIAALVEDLMGDKEEALSRGEALMDYYAGLVQKPLNLNTADERQLEDLGLLNPFQIALLLDYRKKYGNLYSLNELALLPGFGEETVRRMAPFVCIKNAEKAPALKFGNMIKNGRNSFLIRTKTFLPHGRGSDTAHAGPPFLRYAKYKWEYYNRVSMQLTLESDAGEAAWADFVGGNVQLQHFGSMRRLIVGDFQVRFGQGLVLWNGLNIGSNLSSAGFRKKGAALSPYGSTGETHFFRGMAGTWDFGPFSFSAFASYCKVDARLKDSVFSSLPEDGYHRTAKEKETRHTLPHGAAGLQATVNSASLRVGIQAFLYAYGARDGRAQREYTRFRSRRNPFGSAGLDFHWQKSRLSLYGEFAVDYAGKWAALAGMHYRAGDCLNIGALARYYQVGYTAPYAGAYAMNSAVCNERGAGLNFNAVMGRRWELEGFADLAYFPWTRYNCSGPSHAWEFLTRLRFKPAEERQFYLMLGGRRRQLNVKGVKTDRDRYQARFHAQFALSDAWTWTSRLEYVRVPTRGQGLDRGLMCYGEGKYRSGSGRWTVSLRGAVFCTSGWNARIYAYESEVLYGFSFPALYGKGYRAYVNMRYSPLSCMDIWFRAACGGGFGSGTSFKSEWKLQCRLRW